MGDKRGYLHPHAQMSQNCGKGVAMPVLSTCLLSQWADIELKSCKVIALYLIIQVLDYHNLLISIGNFSIHRITRVTAGAIELKIPLTGRVPSKRAVTECA